MSRVKSVAGRPTAPESKLTSHRPAPPPCTTNRNDSRARGRETGCPRRETQPKARIGRTRAVVVTLCSAATPPGHSNLIDTCHPVLDHDFNDDDQYSEFINNPSPGTLVSVIRMISPLEGRNQSSKTCPFRVITNPAAACTAPDPVGQASIIALVNDAPSPRSVFVDPCEHPRAIDGSRAAPLQPAGANSK